MQMLQGLMLPPSQLESQQGREEAWAFALQYMQAQPVPGLFQHLALLMTRSSRHQAPSHPGPAAAAVPAE